MRAAKPMIRLWRSCAFEPEGKVVAHGDGLPAVSERFSISANGTEIEMIVVHVVSDRTWTAQDFESYTREHTHDH